MQDSTDRAWREAGTARLYMGIHQARLAMWTLDENEFGVPSSTAAHAMAILLAHVHTR